MTTLAKAQANRSNALMSTGPRTAAGKAIVARNAVRHSLLSREVFVEGESKAAFCALAGDLWDSLQPVGALENLLVDRVVSATWRLRRVHTVEADLFFPKTHGTLGDRFDADSRYSNSFSKLSRYEAAIERSLFRALHELERLQTRRSGGHVLPSAVLDLEVAVQGVEET